MTLAYIANILQEMIINAVNMKPIFIMKSRENIPDQLSAGK